MNIIVEDTGNRTKDRQVLCIVKCHCGKEFETERRNVLKDRIKSCGCSKIKNLIGKKFGKIEVIANTGKTGNGKSGVGAIWLCRCSCGKTLELSTARLNNPKRWSCGCDKTRVIAACKRKSGINHHWYNNSLENRKFRSSEEQNTFKKNVYIRDNYTCSICMNRGGNLNAHHLDGYHWCHDKRSIIENGITLCEYCHDTFHKIYGNKNNTRFQFLEFKKDYADLLRQ